MGWRCRIIAHAGTRLASFSGISPGDWGNHVTPDLTTYEVGHSSPEERLSFRTLSCRKLSDRSFARLDSVPLRKAGVLTCSGRLIAQGLYALFNSSVIWQVRENQQRIGGKAG